MQFPAPIRYAVGDIELAVYEKGEGRPVVLAHGFPELAYSWRHQLSALAAAGYRAIAYDMRGIGESDVPVGIEHYGIEHLVADLVGLVDAMGLESPIPIGHDWGSIVVQSAAVLHPERFSAAGTLNTPYRGFCTAFPPVSWIAENAADRFGYVLWFHDGTKADEAFARDPARFLRRFYDGAAVQRDFLTEADFARFVDAFTRTGITPALSYYRNIDANIARTADRAHAVIEIPYLTVLADGDPVLPPSLADGMEQWVPNMRRVMIADSGHWVQQEQPEAVSAAILDFLESVA